MTRKKKNKSAQESGNGVGDLASGVEELKVTSGDGITVQVVEESSERVVVSCATLVSPQNSTDSPPPDKPQSASEEAQCPVCLAVVPASQRSAHKAHCGKTSAPPKKAKVRKGRATSAAVPAPVELDGALSSAADDDIDALIAAATALDNTCGGPGCKKSTKMMWQDCTYCGRRYCIPHSTPESHGCRHMARGAESAAFKADFRRKIDSEWLGNPQHRPLNEAGQAYVKRKFEQKMNDMASQRKGTSSKK